MKNPYVRYVLITSLIVSFIYTLAVIFDVMFIHIASDGDSGLSIMRSIEYILTIPLFWSVGSGESVAFIFAIALEFIGPIIIFIFWFVVLYIVTFIFSKIIKSETILSTSTQPKKVSTRTLVITSIVVLLILTIIMILTIINLGIFVMH